MVYRILEASLFTGELEITKVEGYNFGTEESFVRIFFENMTNSDVLGGTIDLPVEVAYKYVSVNQIEWIDCRP